MNVTTIPVGTTGISLEGVAVSTGVRESVILTSPNDPFAFAEIVSSQPINFYGLPVWVQGQTAPTGTTQVFGQTSTQIVSSIPFYVSQSSAPWTMNGAVAVTSNVTIQGTSSVNVLNTLTANVTNVPLVTVQGTSSVNVLNAPTVNVTNVPLVTVQGTSSVNVISSVAHAISGTVSTQVVSSIPFFVAQSSAPWLMNGALSVTNSPNVNVTNVPSVNITSSIPFFVAQSSGPWTVNVSSIAGSSVSTVAAGVQGVGLLGGAGGRIDGAQNAAVPASALLVGVESLVGSLPTTTAAGNLQAAASDSAGRIIMYLYNPRELIGQQATSMSTAAATTETTIVTSSSATFRDLCSLIITTNGSAAGNWRLRDATGTTTPAYVFNTPATAGSVLSLQFQPPLKQGLVNQNWTLQSSGTSTTAHIVTQFTNTQ